MRIEIWQFSNFNKNVQQEHLLMQLNLLYQFEARNNVFGGPSINDVIYQGEGKGKREFDVTGEKCARMV